MFYTREELIKQGIKEDDYYATVTEHEGEWVTTGVSLGTFIIEYAAGSNERYTEIPQDQAWDIMMGL